MSKPRANTTATDDATWRWTALRLEAAAAVALDELTDDEIARNANVSRATLKTWRKHPVFAAKVEELVEEAGETCKRYAIGRKARRLAAMNRRWLALQQIIEARAVDCSTQGRPGAATGLLVLKIRVVGTGQHQRTVEEMELDAPLMKELRELERAAAEELGQLPRVGNSSFLGKPEFFQEEDGPLYRREE